MKRTIVFAGVRDELVRTCEAAACPPNAELVRPADAAVRALWDSRVELFVSVLAVLHAQEMLIVAN